MNISIPISLQPHYETDKSLISRSHPLYQKTYTMVMKSNKRQKIIHDDSNSAGYLKFLPTDIIIDILARLPIDSVIQCKRVCRAWRFLSHDPSFAALHTHRFITSSSSSQIIKSAAPFIFLLFVAQKDYNVSSTTYYRLHFGEYHDDKDEDDNNNANKKKKKKNKIVISNHNNNANKKKKNKIVISNHERFSSTNNKLIRHYPFHHNEFDELKKISSCNGLLLTASILCSHGNHDDDMIVFNPLTREYVRLPPLAGQVPKLVSNITLSTTGFGYHPSTHEYKVVIITHPASCRYLNSNNNIINPAAEEDDLHGYVYVYTLGSGRWRSRFIDSSYSNFHYMGVLLNGALHWIGLKGDDEGLLSFDLANEELKILSSPQEDRDHLYDIEQHLGVLGGYLCISRYKRDSSRIDIWVQTKNHHEYPAEADSCSSWTKKFSIDSSICGLLPRNYEFVGLESGKILLSSSHDGRLHLLVYDPETGNVHEHDQSENFSANRIRYMSVIDLVPYVKSFVSLKGLGEETAKYI